MIAIFGWSEQTSFRGGPCARRMHELLEPRRYRVLQYGDEASLTSIRGTPRIRTRVEGVGVGARARHFVSFVRVYAHDFIQTQSARVCN